QRLALEASGVTPEASRRVQHAMAGNDDRDRVGPERVASRARAARAAGSGRHLLVRRDGPERDLARRLQHAAAEAAGQLPVELQLEPVASSGEVLLELPPRFVE